MYFLVLEEFELFSPFFKPKEVILTQFDSASGSQFFQSSYRFH